MILGQTGIVHANDRLIRLSLPTELVESGLPKYLFPRFSLKTQVRVETVAPGEEAEIALGSEGRPVFTGLDQTWSMQVVSTEHPGAQKFADWIRSEIGQRAVTSYVVDGVQMFDLPQLEEVETVVAAYDGDAALGAIRSQEMCGRCHVVDPARRMSSIDSSPSFFALRSLPDWEDRFQTFYVLNPHPAFTQIADVTPPFPDELPPPIVPVEMTLEDVDAILAFVAALTPADLGAPLQHQ
ncbi:hypothetical protein GCM10011517_15590 [Actibacterium pelagium]|uniref:Cytochrome c domain-containing protein n=2 Tax=Actibacterium pelagium TaxID=2029103 RepID=A0A917AFJ1_9RHOB|nr:hypothetical protein GCM10011517_15590 [Actibacterium pelagium]